MDERPAAPGWQPLLDPESAARATAAAVALGDRMLADPDALRAYPPSVANGTAGAAVFLTALDTAAPGRGYAGEAVALLDDGIAHAAEQERPDVALYGSPVGLGWAYAALAPRLPGGEADTDENDIDAFVAAVLRIDPWPGALDLAFGLAGLGTYALARLPLPGARESLERVVAHLATAARPDGPGVTWPFVPPSRERFVWTPRLPQGHVDVGFAHGVAGIVTLLAEATAVGTPGARDLLEPAVSWLLGHRLPPGEHGAYPGTVLPGGEPNAARLAWCYGDPGVAVGLLAAGRALGDTGLVEEARAVATGCADRDGADVADRTFCHGSAGLGHLFNRLGQSLGDERLLDLARRWFAATLDGPLPEVAAEPGVLLGASGAGLCLLSAAGVEPWWDQVVLVRRPATW